MYSFYNKYITDIMYQFFYAELIGIKKKGVKAESMKGERP